MVTIILRGLPGSGKSYHCSLVMKDFKDSIICSADHFWMRNPQGVIDPAIYNFDPKRLQEAHSDCLKKFLSYAIGNYELLIVDNTNLAIHEIAPYYQASLAFGRDTKILTIDAPIALCLKRQTHKVPPETIGRMSEVLQREQKLFPPWWKHEVVKVEIPPEMR